MGMSQVEQNIEFSSLSSACDVDISISGILDRTKVSNVVDDYQYPILLIFPA
jgi:hypothetical protein